MITLPRAESHWTRGCETEAGGEGGGIHVVVFPPKLCFAKLFQVLGYALAVG